MRFEVAVKPMTTNRLWQGRRYKTKEYKSFREEVGWLLPKKKVEGWVKIRYVFHIKHYATTDVDNLIKPFTDCLVDMGVIEDDRKVVEVTAKKVKSDVEKVGVEITQLKNLEDQIKKL